MGSGLEGKVAFVTGASRGIGAAIAERLARAGAHVAAVARSLDEAPRPGHPGTLRDTVARIEAAGGRAVAIQGDVLDAASRAAAVARCALLLGPIDVLINNAAAGPYRTFEKFTEKDFRITFEANVRAPLELAQLVVPGMRAKGRGWIVNVSSATAEPEPGPPYSAFSQKGGAHLYAASKAALNRLTQGLAAELYESNIAVNTLAPVAAVLTPAVTATGADKYLTPEMIEPIESIAEAALLLSCCDAKTLTGRITYSLRLLEQAAAPATPERGRS
jgi:citronellol/citronellal dehydrogenase